MIVINWNLSITTMLLLLQIIYLMYFLKLLRFMSYFLVIFLILIKLINSIGEQQVSYQLHPAKGLPAKYQGHQPNNYHSRRTDHASLQS